MSEQKLWPLFPRFLIGPFVWECVAYIFILAGITIPLSFMSQDSIPTVVVVVGFLSLWFGAFIWLLSREATGQSAVAQVFERLQINRMIRKNNK